MPFANDDTRRAHVRSYHRDPANRETVSRAKLAYVERNHEKVLESKRAWRRRNPEAAAAHSKLQYAVRKGRLERQPCEVCGERAEAHHDDYSKPLEVRWLCKAHHMEHHRRVA